MDAIQAHPDAAWYILGDDDTIFNVDNLLLILQVSTPPHGPAGWSHPG